MKKGKKEKMNTKVFFIEQDGVVFEFDCESRDTRNGFAHDCTVTIDGEEVAHYTAHYYNRTWEAYRYQSAMNAAIRRFESEIYAEMLMTFKRERKYKSMSAKRREEFELFADGNEDLRRIEKLKKAIEEGRI